MKSWPFFVIGVVSALVAERVFGASYWQGVIVAGAVAAIVLLAQEGRR